MSIIKIRAFIAYPRLNAPQANKLNPNKRTYSAQLIIEHGSESETLLQRAINDCAVAKWASLGAKTLAFLKANNRLCYRVDAEAANAGKALEPYLINRGKLSASCDSARKRPKLYMADATPVDVLDVFDGAEVNAFVSVWAQDNADPQIGKRINCELVGIQLIRNPAEPWQLGGGATMDESMLDVIRDESAEIMVGDLQ